MKISRITIENFRAIKTLELPLDPQLTVLVGNNAAGKTTILLSP
jgi:recombinational DNA repair ATPase RecF